MEPWADMVPTRCTTTLPDDDSHTALVPDPSLSDTSNARVGDEKHASYHIRIQGIEPLVTDLR